jgi:hypothetical protein
VPPPPTIDSFTASAARLPAGEKLILSWQTTNATAIELREATDGVLPVAVTTVDGSYELQLAHSGLYVLRARGEGGSDARAISVQLDDDGATDVTFQVFPPEINGGDTATLAWSAPGAKVVTLAAGSATIDVGGQRSSGAVTVSPKFDTTYTLNADGVTRSVNVSVAPTFLGAQLSRGAANVGDSVIVTWSVAGADKVTLSSPGRGQLSQATTPGAIEAGTFTDTVPPTPDNGLITYELVAEKGTTSVRRTLELGVGTGLGITRFIAPAVAGAGAAYTVRWETRSSDRVEIKVDDATVYFTATQAEALSGSYSFTAPTADFSVGIVATNARGARESQRLQVDAVGVPASVTLTASPASVTVGQAVTLTWASAEARLVRITDSQGDVVFSSMGQSAEGGTATVYPVANTTYTIRADNMLGNPAVTATADVTTTGTAPTLTQDPPTAISGQRASLVGPAGSLVYGFPHTQVLTASQAAFTDISATGTRVFESPSEVGSVTLPFSTLLWGTRTGGALTVSRAGWMAWGSALTVLASPSVSWPSTTAPGGAIAPFWANLTLVPGVSGIYAQVVGNAPEEVLVVQWDKMRFGTDATTELTFQVQVHQRGMISFQYKTMTVPASATHLRGLQDQLRAQFRTQAGLPTANSAVYFFSPVSTPIEVQAIKGGRWGGYLKSGNSIVPAIVNATAVLVPSELALTEVMHRPSPDVPNGQFIEVLNRTSSALDLRGWSLTAPNTPTFSLTQSFLLQPGVPTVIGASTDSAQNDDAGVTLAWGNFFLASDAGTFTLGNVDAGIAFNYVGPADAGTGSSIDVDPGPFVGTTGTPGAVSCPATTGFGNQTPQQLGSPGALGNCGFGYAYRSIPVNFRDLTDAGTAILNSTTAVDGRTVPINLDPTDAGLPLPSAWGAPQQVVSVSTDGWMVFGSTTTTAFSNATVTSTSSTTKGKLAIFWDDLQTTVALTPPSEMFWKRFEPNEDPTTPARHWVFQWARVRHYNTSPADDLNFEIKLFEDGSIEYHYATMTSGTSLNYANGNSATVWLEKPDGTQALVLSINQPVVQPNTAFRFVPR